MNEEHARELTVGPHRGADSVGDSKHQADDGNALKKRCGKAKHWR